MLIAIDLGKLKSGVAAFNHAGVLVGAATVTISKDGTAETMANAIMEWSRRFCGTTFYVEKPQKYRGARVKHDDLEALLDVLHLLCEKVGPGLTTVLPHAWKASVPKPIHHARVLRVLGIREQIHWHGIGHDGRDAVGLGLFYLGRVARGGVPTLTSHRYTTIPIVPMEG